MSDESQIPSTTVGYFFSEALRRIWVSKRSSFVAVAMIAISLLIVGSFLLISENLGRAVVIAQGKSRVEVYLVADATPAQISAVDSYPSAHREFARRPFGRRDQ